MDRAARQRLRRLVLPALLAVAGAGAWFALRTGADEADLAWQERPAAASDAEAPLLRGAVAAPRGERGAAPGPGPALAGTEVATAEEHRLALRLVDARGRPLSFARVHVTVLVVDARGTRHVRLSAQADEDGRVAFTAPSRRVLSVEVECGGGLGQRQVAAFEQGTDAAALEAADLVAEGVQVLRVLTLDGRGVGVADRRILYRPVQEGREPSGYWGDRSGMDCIAVLGPFPTGSVVELAPGPRGTAAVEANPGPWQRVTVDGTRAEVNVGDGPRLRLRIAGVASDAEIPINGRAARLEGGVWLGPEVHPRTGLDVTIGPLPDGRFAWLRSLYAEEQPIDVELEPGQRVTGRLSGGPASARWTGTVSAEGERWSAEVALGDDGAFSFPGLPTARRTILLRLDGRVAPSGQAYLAEALWSGDAHVELAVTPAFVLRGRVQIEGRDGPPPHCEVSASVAGFRSEWPARVEPDGSFRVLVPGGSCTLAAQARFPQGAESWGSVGLGKVAADRDDVLIAMGAPE